MKDAGPLSLSVDSLFSALSARASASRRSPRTSVNSASSSARSFQPGSKGLEDIFKSIHAWAAFGLAVILAGHVAAALRHQFIRRDGLLRRMILGR